jgi:hypothetical protein
MKKIFLFALAALALVACNDKRQSELTEEVLMKGTAKIAVEIRYSPGLHKVDGAYKDIPLALPADASVFAKADYTEYGAAGNNIKQFPATLNNGMYEMVIPAGEKPIKVQIVVNGFYGDYYANPDQETPDKAYYPKFEPKDLIYTVLAGQSFVETDPQKTIIPAPASALLPKQDYVITSVSGKLQGKQEYWDKDKDYNEIQTDMLGLSGRTIILEIKAADAKQDPRVLQFKSSSTNANGDFKFENIKIFDQWVDSLKADADYLKMNLILEPWTAEFTHYYRVLDSSPVKEVWDSEATYNLAKTASKTYDADPDVAFAKYLAEQYQKDGEKLKYFYPTASNKTENVPGYWKVSEKTDTVAIGNVQGNIVMFKSAEQDIQAKFFVKDVKKIMGVGYFGADEEVKLKDDKYVVMPGACFKDPMGWAD